MSNHDAYDREWTMPAYPGDPVRTLAKLYERLSDLGLLTEAAQLVSVQSQLAAARARIAALTEALRVIATQSVYEDDEYAYQLRDMIDAAREVAQDALAEPGKPEETRG